ncbi:MAG TPA: hypothetical protein PLL77_06095 [Pyrinomonadaceae bacterium]|nr:hypothetical protein [Pyrinomonadaceae bacterium]
MAWIFKTVAEASTHLGISQSGVRGRIRRGELDSTVIDGVIHVRFDAALQGQVQQGINVSPPVGDPWGRRNFILQIGALLTTIACSDGALRYWDELNRETLGKSPKDIERIFSHFSNIEVVPGMVHPAFLGKPHPDIVEAQNDLLPFFPAKQVEILKLDDLPKPNIDGNMLLIGGPVSNAISRTLRGFKLKNGKLVSNGKLQRELGWEFHYSEEKGQPGFRRYVNGTMVESKPKYITGGLQKSALNMLSASFDPVTRFLDSDLLLITHIQNIVGKQSQGNDIIDIADLHGQGDKGFAKILDDDQLRNELFEATGKKGINHFQALYSVPVIHDHLRKTTTAGKPKLLDIFKIGKR